MVFSKVYQSVSYSTILVQLKRWRRKLVKMACGYTCAMHSVYLYAWEALNFKYVQFTPPTNNLKSISPTSLNRGLQFIIRNLDTLKWIRVREVRGIAVCIINWKKPQYPKKTTDLSQDTDIIYHIILYQIHLAMSGIENL